MEEQIVRLVEAIALATETAAALFIAIGAAIAVTRLATGLVRPAGSTVRQKKHIWVGFGVWLLFALEFELAADLLRTAISPTWDDIGQLAAIAGIRTVLNYFLEKDIERYAEEPAEPVAALSGS